MFWWKKVGVSQIVTEMGKGAKCDYLQIGKYVDLH